MIKSFNCKIDDVEEKGIVTVYANAFGNVDSDNDRSHKGSYTKTIKESFHRVKWFLNHGFWSSDNFLLGVPLEAKQDNDGLKVTGKLNMKKQISKDILEDYKLYAEHDRTLEHSLAVDAVKYEIDQSTGIRDVKEWAWWEYSTLTSWGSNENTPLVSIKGMQSTEALDFLSKMFKGKYTDERFKEIEKLISQLKSLVENEPIDSLINSKEPINLIEVLNKSKLIKT